MTTHICTTPGACDLTDAGADFFVCDGHLAKILETAMASPSETGDLLTDLLVRSARRVETPTAPRHTPLVYFLRANRHVKIGTTTQLTNRFSDLGYEGVLPALLLDGGRLLEGALHRRFHRNRVGNTEWFEWEGTVSRYVEDKGSEQAVPARPFTLTDAVDRRTSHLLSSTAVFAALDSVLKDQLAVHLAEVAKLVSGLTGRAASLEDVSLTCQMLHIPTRRSVKVKGSVRTGIHRDDYEVFKMTRGLGDGGSVIDS